MDKSPLRSPRAMRILHIVHSFPPQAVGGTEHYVLQLAAAQLSSGHDAAVLYPLILPAGARTRLIRDRYPLADLAFSGNAAPGKPRSLPVFKVTNPNRDSLYWTAFNAEAEERVVEAVREFLPEVVHIHHLYWLSARLVERLKNEFPAVRVVMTLHDYWYACYKATLSTPRGELCTGPSSLKCMGCIEQRGLLFTGMRALSGSLGDALHPLLRAGISRLPSSVLERSRPDTMPRRQLANAWFFALREREMVRALAAADALVAPSSHLASWYEGWLASRGIRRKIEVVKQPVMPAKQPAQGKQAHRQRREEHPFTFGYIGQFAPHKGAHHLLKAFRAAALDLLEQHPSSREQLPKLLLYGPAPLPAYLRELHALSAVPGPLIVDRISFEGRFEHRELQRVLGGIDLLVVPSRWPENAPLAVAEALSAGVPVLAPRLGGLPEMIDPKGEAGSSGVRHVPGGWLYGSRGELPSDRELTEAILVVLAEQSQERLPPSGRGAAGGIPLEAHCSLLERAYGIGGH